MWRTLLQARAMENAVWVVGCAVAASVWPGEEFAGAGSHVFDPVGEAVRTRDDHTFELDLDRASEVVVDPLRLPPGVAEVEVHDVPDGPAGARPCPSQ